MFFFILNYNFISIYIQLNAYNIKLTNNKKIEQAILLIKKSDSPDKNSDFGRGGDWWHSTSWMKASTFMYAFWTTGSLIQPVLQQSELMQSNGQVARTIPKYIHIMYPAQRALGANLGRQASLWSGLPEGAEIFAHCVQVLSQEGQVWCGAN